MRTTCAGRRRVAGRASVLFAVFGGMLLYSDFLPYTFDNNESFAAYLHARNMYEFGIVSSSGLPDESLSNDVAAHPYLYTHAGASPRLFAYAIYVLGARTVEQQLAVTAFTVGLLAFWFRLSFSCRHIDAALRRGGVPAAADRLHHVRAVAYRALARMEDAATVRRPLSRAPRCRQGAVSSAADGLRVPRVSLLLRDHIQRLRRGRSVPVCHFGHA